jgi:hypothetical protein
VTSRRPDATLPLDLTAGPALALSGQQAIGFESLQVVVPLLGLGLLLLLGAALLTPRRLPLPEIAMPLYAYRYNLVAVGATAIALALLWLNITVLFS